MTAFTQVSDTIEQMYGTEFSMLSIQDRMKIALDFVAADITNDEYRDRIGVWHAGSLKDYASTIQN